MVVTAFPGERARAASALQEERAEAEQKLKDLKRSLGSAETELISMQARLVDSQTQLAGAESELLRVQQELSSTQSSATAAEAAFAEMQQRMTAKGKQVTTAEAVLLAREEEVLEIEKRTALAKDRLASTELKLAEEQRTATVASADLDAVCKHLNETQGRLAEAQSELGLTRDALAETQHRKEASRADIEDLQRKAAEVKAALEKLEELLGETNDKTAAIEDRHAEAQKELATVEANLDLKRQEVAKLEQDAAVARKELEASMVKLADTQKKIAAAQEEHGCTQSAATAAKSELAGIRVELEGAELGLSKVQSKAAARKTELAETQAKLACEQQMLAKAQSEAKAAKAELEATNSQQIRAQDLAAGTEIELMNTRNRLREGQSLEEASQRELSTSRSHLQEVRRKAAEAQRELDARARELRGLEHAQAAARADLVGLQRKLTEGARLAGLQQEMICGGEDFREQPSHQGPLTPAPQAPYRSYRSPAQHLGHKAGSMSRELEGIGAGLHNRPDQNLFAHEKEAEKLQRELDGLRAELHQCEDKVSEAHIKLADLHAEARILRQKNQAAADSLQVQLQDQVSPLNVQAAKRQRVTSLSEWPQPSIVRELERRVEDLRGQLLSAERRARAAEDRAADSLGDVQLALEQADQDRQALGKDLWSEQQRRMDAEVKLQQASRRVDAAEAEAHAAADRLGDTKMAHAHIAQQLASEQSRCSAAEKSAAALTEKLAAACLAYEEAGEKLLRMDASHCRLEGRLQGAVRARDAASGEQGTLEHELERLLQRHKQARAAQRAAERDLRDCQAGREEAEHAQKDTQAALTDAAAKAEAATAALSAEQAAHAKTVTQLQEAEQLLQCARAEACEATRWNTARAHDLQEARDAAERLREDNRALELSLDSLRGSLKMAHDTREAAELRAFEGERRLASVLGNPPPRDISRSFSPGEMKREAHAAELEQLETSIKPLQAQLALLTRQVAQQEDILHCTQADLHQARTELQAVEEAREQLATVQRHLDELERSLPGMAAEAAEAIRQGSPESARKVAALQQEVASAKKELSNADRCWQAAEAGRGGTRGELRASRQMAAFERKPGSGKLLRMVEKLSREVIGLAQENGAQRTAAARMVAALQDATEQVAGSSASLRQRLERKARLASSQRDNEASEGVLQHLTAVEGILDGLQASAWSSLSLGPEKQPGSLQQHYNRALRRAGIEADSQLVSDVAEEGAARTQRVEEELQQLITSIVRSGNASGLL